MSFNFKNKNILLISPDPWNHIFVSKHHYATYLSVSGANVIFVNPPKNQWKLSPTDHVNLRILDYPKFTKGLRAFPSFISRRIILKKINNIESFCELKFDVVWSFDNSVFFDFKLLSNNTLCISHIMDLNQNFQTKEAAGTANICFGVIPEIVARLKKYNSNSFLIRHGVNVNNENTKKIILPGNNSTKALYAGNLNMPYIDWNLLLRAAKRFDKVDFIMIGSNDNSEITPKKQEFIALRNVYLCDPVSANELYNYLKSADILLLAYSLDYYKNYASPHKMMEYLAAAKPIVASYTSDYSDYSDVIYMSKHSSGWINQLNNVISNLSHYSSKKYNEKRKEISLNNTYEKQIKRIEKHINQTGQYI